MKIAAALPPLIAQFKIQLQENTLIQKIKEKIAKTPLGKFHPTPQQKKYIKIGAVILGLLTLRATYLLFFTESTDDSFVKSNVHIVSSRILGTVDQIMVGDNQKVKKGDVILKLDPRDYAVQVKAAQANYSKAHKDLGRFQGFGSLGPSERPVFDQYQAAALVTEADLDRAQLQLEYTSVVAAEDGKIGKQTVHTGELVQPGQALMALVESNPWIEANFKENQITHIRPGQEVEIKVDSISDKKFIGHVDSISPGSGSTFSLLPPDNATGNFTKIVQRIPVKIVFDKESVEGFEDRLVSGMSTEVRVKTW